RRHPHPVDRGALDQALQCGVGLVGDHVGQRAGGRGEGHVDGGRPVVLDVNAVDEAEIDHVDAELGVNDVLHRLGDVLLGGPGGSGGGRRRVRQLVPYQVRGTGGGVLAHGHSWLSSVVVVPPLPEARATASASADHPSRAHFTRAGNFATPANAMPSSSRSSSGSMRPCPCISSVNSSRRPIACSTVPPMTSSVITEVEACEMEQPTVSHDTSATRSPSRCTRSVSSSPQLGLTWWASPSYGSRSP